MARVLSVNKQEHPNLTLVRILMAESGHNAMALIVASPSVQFTTSKGCLDLDIVLDGEDDEMAKKMRIASSSDAVGSAEAAGQPRREP